MFINGTVPRTKLFSTEMILGSKDARNVEILFQSMIWIPKSTQKNFEGSSTIRKRENCIYISQYRNKTRKVKGENF